MVGWGEQVCVCQSMGVPLLWLAGGLVSVDECVPLLWLAGVVRCQSMSVPLLWLAGAIDEVCPCCGCLWLATL